MRQAPAWVEEILHGVKEGEGEFSEAPYGYWILSKAKSEFVYFDTAFNLSIGTHPDFSDAAHFLEHCLRDKQWSVLNFWEGPFPIQSRIEYFQESQIHFFQVEIHSVTISEGEFLIALHKERLQIDWPQDYRKSFNYFIKTDTEVNYEYMNQSYQEVFTRDLEVLPIGSSAAARIMPQSIPETQKQVEAALASPEESFELLVDKIDARGEVLSSFWQIQYWPNPGPLSGGIYARAYDVSEAEQRLATLNESRRELSLYHAFFDNTYDAIHVSNTDGQLIYLNGEASKRLGIALSEVQHYRVQDFEEIFKENPDYWDEHVQYLREHSHWSSKSSNFNQETGEEHVVDVVVKLVEISGREYIVANSRDISDQEKLKVEVEEKERELSLFFDNTLLGAFFMTLPRPLNWDENTDKEKELDWVFENMLVTRVNQAMLDQYGFQHENEILGFRPSDFYAHDIESGRNDFRKFFDTGRLQLVTEERTVTGEQVIFEGDYVPIQNEDGRLIGLFGVQQDITEKEKARRAVEQSRLQLQNLTEQIPGVVFQMKIKGAEPELYFLSSSFDQLALGFNREEMMANPSLFLDRIDRADYSMVIGSILHAYRKSQNLNVDFRFTSSHGLNHFFNAEARAVKDGEGQVSWFGVLSDRSEFRRVEEQQRRLIHATRNINDGILILDKEAKINWLNEAGEVFLGAEFLSLVKRGLGECIRVKNDSKEALEEFLVAVHDRRSADALLALQLEKKSLWSQLEHKPVWNENGEYLYGLVLFRDVNEMFNKQQELQKLLDLAADQNKRLQSFTYIVSHNIRSYSANLRGLLDALDKEKDAKDREKLWQYLRDVSSGLDETIRDLNDIITLETNLNKQKQKVSLRKQIDGILKIIQVQLDEIGAQLKVEVDPDLEVNLVPSYGDSIILNLLTNTIRYREPSRTLEVKVSYDETKKYHVLKVKDNGLGIDLKKHGDSLFNLYQTFHNNPEARGLGLYILKSQAEAMGGKVEVASKVGQGTTFKIYFKKKA